MYKALQHPLVNNFISPYTLKERLLHVAEAQRRTKTKFTWICDDMKNSIKHALGSAPNGEFVIDPKGKIVRKRFWSDPDTLRYDLEGLVGPVDKITKVKDLDVVFKVETRKIASGIVPRLKLPQLSPIQVKPVDSGDPKLPFYVKLRAEAERSLLPPRRRPGGRPGRNQPDPAGPQDSANGAGRKGKLYLGFYLDPIYKVHWNNQAGKIQVELGGEGVTFAKSQLAGPKVDHNADVDPREFLVETTVTDATKPINVVFKYVACDDAETFCLPLTQKYSIQLKPDRDGGSRPGTFMPPMFAGIRDFDRNRDGRITRRELPPGRVTLFIGHLDYNNDQMIDMEEIKRFEQMFNNGRGLQANTPAAKPAK